MFTRQTSTPPSPGDVRVTLTPDPHVFTSVWKADQYSSFTWGCKSYFNTRSTRVHQSLEGRLVLLLHMGHRVTLTPGPHVFASVWKTDQYSSFTWGCKSYFKARSTCSPASGSKSCTPPSPADIRVTVTPGRHAHQHLLLLLFWRCRK